MDTLTDRASFIIVLALCISNLILISHKFMQTYLIQLFISKSLKNFIISTEIANLT